MKVVETDSPVQFPVFYVRQTASLYFVFVACAFAAISPAYSEERIAISNAGAVVEGSFPPEFFALLKSGIEVPFQLKSSLGLEEAGKAKLRFGGQFLTIDQVALSHSRLTADYQRLLELQYGKPLDYSACNEAELTSAGGSDSGETHSASQNTQALALCFDPMTFQLIGVLPADAYLTETASRIKTLADSTEKGISGILNYQATAIKLNQQDADGYIHLTSTTSSGVNHLVLDGDIRSNQQAELYEARLTRDYKGMNISAGYLGQWALNRLGKISYTRGGKFVGVSAGNQAASQQVDTSQSQNPIYVYMPASGQVSIYRDEKLINVQQLALGNREVDSRSLPPGNYPVRVDVVVNGRVVSSTTEMIYKNYISGNSDQLQVFAGRFLEDTENSENPWLAGVSGSLATPWLDMNASLYSYGSLVAFEPGFQKNFAHGSLSGQLSIASDQSYSSNLTGNLNWQGSSIWLMHDQSQRNQQDSASYKSQSISMGSTLNFQSVFETNKVSFLTLSLTEDRITHNRTSRIDFTQALYENRWLSATLNAGKYWQTQPGSVMPVNTGGSANSFMGSSASSQQSYYVGINFNFSFGRGGIDYSRSLNAETIGVNAAWTPEDVDGLSYLGGGVSRSRSLGDSTDDPVDRLNLRANGTNRFFAWDGAIGANNNGVDLSAGISGSMGWNQDGAGLSSGRSDAGVIVKVDDEARGDLDLMINGFATRLENGSSFVPVTAFSKAPMSVRSSARSAENYEIEDSEKDFVLYPGNVGILKPKLKRLVTVFGVLTEAGKPKGGVLLKNHIGTATTEADGSFSVDVDSKNPSVSYEMAENNTCQIDFDLRHAKGALWVDEVSCAAPMQLASLSLN